MSFAMSRSLQIPLSLLMMSFGLLTGAGPARAAQEVAPRAVIHFADLGGIDDWRAEGSDAIQIRGRNGQWYRATFFGSCIGLQFADTIAFVTDSTGDLDRFASLLVDGDRCWFRTLEKIPDPTADTDGAAKE